MTKRFAQRDQGASGAGTTSWTPRMRLTVLGTRGSISTSGPQYAAYGGATSCYLVEAGGEHIFLDAGTGLAMAPDLAADTVTILVSHLHLDHIGGLAMYGRLSTPGTRTRLILPTQTAEEGRQALDALFAPPLWPLRLDQLEGELAVEALPADGTLTLGSVSVRAVEGNHPGGCKAFRVEHDGKSVTYVTDYEREDASFARLVALAEGTDLLLVDGQYADEELAAHAGFGHATPSVGLDLMRQSGAKRLLVIHHDPRSTDKTLRARERALGNPVVRFAHEREVIEL